MYPNFVLEMNDFAVVWVSFASPLPGVGGSTKRQIPQEADLAVCVRTAEASREKVWAWDNLKSPGRWWISHFWELPFVLFFNNLLELYPRLMEHFMKGDEREIIFR